MRRAPHDIDPSAPGGPRHPHVPVRQWVQSLPIPLRPLLAAQPRLVPPLLQAVHHGQVTDALLAHQGHAVAREQAANLIRIG